ncbi:RNA polymerase sigma factor [Planctomyces sp. SH-PL62]|uniref:RNA polymerase sigma factor n=1 Tax=Planctomyces sp. SH-PL62 TaxID=1636152 RepID=UPI00078B2594|nr:sigma-70 family RNA polymerase sigma factor [Planctomyces sp. SH-PL62]AMV38938.1 ECF RNA polymerase sigma factor SigW [Planctomyces sp. SH-PL62]
MTRNLDDSSLVQACRAGDAEAYGVLVERCQGRLYPMVLRLVGSPEDAQDVLQDAFVRGFEKLDQYQGGSAFSTWMYRIAVNLAMSRLRKGRLRRALRLLAPGRGRPALDPADESPSSVPSYAVERAEREALIEAALAALEPDHRAVVVLKDFEGRRYEEIGELLDIPVGTVRSRLHRARQQLRRRLRPLVDDESPVESSLPDVEQALS